MRARRRRSQLAGDGCSGVSITVATNPRAKARKAQMMLLRERLDIARRGVGGDEG